MLKYVLIFSVVFLFGCGPDPVDEYIAANSSLSAQKILAMRIQKVINGMTSEEVRLILGEPKFVEKLKEKNTERWIYRLTETGTELVDIYAPQSMFPQGLMCVAPLYYRAQEVRVDFCKGVVCQVHEILNFQ